MGAYIDAIGGPRFATFVLAVFLSYVLFSTSALWWPAWRTRRRSSRLSRPALFTGVVATLSYGFVALFTIAFMVLLDGLQSLPGTLAVPARTIASASALVQGWSFIWLPPFLFVVVWLVTHRLASRWPAICQAFDT